MSHPNVGHLVLVPVHDGPPLAGKVIGEGEDSLVGHVFVVQFPSGATARLTDREVVFDDGR